MNAYGINLGDRVRIVWPNCSRSNGKTGTVRDLQEKDCIGVQIDAPFDGHDLGGILPREARRSGWYVHYRDDGRVEKLYQSPFEKSLYSYIQKELG